MTDTPAQMTGDQRVCAIMQPTFLPWLGYFSLIAQADDFVFLDDVQFTKQSWQNRNRISGPNGPVLLSLPVARKPSFPLINEARFGQPDFERKLVARIKGCLGKAPHWPLVERLLETGLARSSHGLSAVNIGFIRDICSEIGIDATFHQTSRMNLPDFERSERLLRICERLKAGIYLSPVGSAGYLRDSNPFSEQGVRLRFMSFAHPQYAQARHAFQSHMSIIDALAWTGPDETRRMIIKGIGTPLGIEALDQPGDDDPRP